jgi:hypothetical protein
MFSQLLFKPVDTASFSKYPVASKPTSALSRPFKEPAFFENGNAGSPAAGQVFLANATALMSFASSKKRI